MATRKVSAIGAKVEAADSTSFRQAEAIGAKIEARDTISYRQIMAIGIMIEVVVSGRRFGPAAQMW